LVDVKLVFCRGLSDQRACQLCPDSIWRWLVFEHSDADARRQPVVMDASTMDFRQAPFSPPFEVVATLEIDALGRPSVADAGFASDDFIR